jgi:iron complex transport system substrate-binding protein
MPKPNLVYIEKLSGIMPVVYLALQLEGNYSERVKKLGYILDSEEAADDYIEWHDNTIDEIRSVTESLPDEEKPRVFPTFFWDGTWNAYGGGYGSIPEMCTIAGGRNIGDVLSTSDHPEVDLEWIAEQDPEVIVVFPTSLCGYENSSDFISIKDSIVNTPLLSNVSAVKNDKVYVMCANCFEYSGSRIVMIAQMAKWYQPELFKDLDPSAIHQEYLDRFQKIDFNVSENKELFALSS